MVQQISALIVQPVLDVSKYSPGAQEKVAADKAMTASMRETGAAAVDTSAKISTSGDVLSRLSRQYVEGYSAQQRFTQGLGQLNRGLETGKISVEGAERILVGMNQRLGLTANAAELAAKGQMTLASAVERANVQIARQANDLAAADAANRRMQAVNSNVVSAGARQAAGFNAGQQLQDIAMMSLVGQSPGVLALQQGPQLATAIQQGGGLAALGAGLTSLLSVTMLLTVGFTAATAATIQWFMKGKDGAKSLDDALKNHSETLRLLKDQYGQLGEISKKVGTEGGPAFVMSHLRSDIAALQAAARTEQPKLLSTLGDQGWLSSLLGSDAGIGGLGKLSGDQRLFTEPVKALIDSAKSGKVDLEAFNDEVERLFTRLVGTSDNSAALRATADAIEVLGAKAFEVEGKFKPFSNAIAQLRVGVANGEPDIRAFIVAVEQLGRQNHLEGLADEAILAAKAFVDLRDKIDEATKAYNRLEAGKRGPLIGSSAEDDRNRYFDDQRLALRNAQRLFDADMAALGARSPQELAAAARAREAARDVNEETPAVKSLRIELAGKRALLEAEHSLAEAADQRSRGLASSLAQQRLELDLIGKTGGEQAKLRFEFERMQELRDQAARTGGPIDDKEVAAIKAAAEEMGKYADALARAKLADDLQFERDQLFRMPQDQQIAARLRGTGIGMNSPEAQMMRENQQFADAKDMVKGFLTTFESTLVSSGGDIGKAMGHSILNALTNSMSKQWEAIFDQLATAFAAALTGQKAGSGGAVASVGTAVSGKLLGGSNDNYAPGAITRSPLPNIGTGSAYSVENATGFIRQYASAIGIDPDTALKVARSEGLGSGIWQSNLTRNGIREPSFGPFQLLKGGPGTGFGTGLGNAFQKQTGLDPANPANWQQSTAFALDQAKANGWGAWFGAKGQGIAGFMGIDRSAAKAVTALDKLSTSSIGTAQSLSDGIGKLGNALNQYPGAPALGGGGGGLFSWFGNLFKATSSFVPEILSGARVGLFADGTENAPPGWAWVGERGPELMRMRGGETIRSNQNSIRMIADNNNGGGMPAFSPVFNVDARGSTMSRAEFEQIAEHQAQSALATYQKTQVRGGFNANQKRYTSLKG